MMKLEKGQITLSKYIESLFYKKSKDENNPDKKLTIGIDKRLITTGIYLKQKIFLYKIK